MVNITLRVEKKLPEG